MTRGANTNELVRIAEKHRKRATIHVIGSGQRAALGQFFTPAPISMLMAEMFRCRRGHVRILDPGAGAGVLTLALVDRLISRPEPPKSISATAYEIDCRLLECLQQAFRNCATICNRAGVHFRFRIRPEDFIEAQSVHCRPFSEGEEQYDCVIMNPPYRKIHSASDERQWLRSAGIETTNVYSAFMLLAARRLADGGEFVSISPRSFCNGPYFETFRRELLQILSLRRLHAFESRTDAFSDDHILQENIILYGTRSSKLPRVVTVSCTQKDGQFGRRRLAPDLIVRRNDPESIVHVPVEDSGTHVKARMEHFAATLADLLLCVSTGRVVDFRARDHLRAELTKNCAPLIYPAHMHRGVVVWPNGQTRKPNAIARCNETDNLLVKSGYYVLVKRFSAKEEPRRIVAALFDPRCIRCAWVGFDNKTNYFHSFGNGLDEKTARGLAAYLNSSIVDLYFRQFSGHTQVNAADLRRIPYPDLNGLHRLSACVDLANQATIDQAIDSLIHGSE